MTRRSCAIYATVIVALIVVVVLIVGIALAGAQVFQTIIHERLKKVSCCLYILVSVMSQTVFTSTFLHCVTIQGFQFSTADASPTCSIPGIADVNAGSFLAACV